MRFFAAGVLLALLVGCGGGTPTAQEKYAAAVELYADEKRLLEHTAIDAEREANETVQLLDTKITLKLSSDDRGLRYKEYEQKERDAVSAIAESDTEEGIESLLDSPAIEAALKAVRDERNNELGDFALEVAALEEQRKAARKKASEAIATQKARVERARLAMLEAEKGL